MSDPLHLTIEARMVYGRVLYYPACPFSTKLAVLMEKKTFSARNLEQFLEFGFDVTYENKELKKQEEQGEEK